VMEGIMPRQAADLLLEALRRGVTVLVAGGTGSGKTFSGLRLARGIAAGSPFAAIDTENGRMDHYAEQFPECQATQITAPFRPAKYADAIEAAQAHLIAAGVPAGRRVIVVDSASHEWYGDGGCLDWHDDLMGGDQKKNLSAWIEPKKQHKRMVTRLLQLDAHVILCFRAEPKVEAVREGGQTKIVPKASLIGLDGWIPIAEKNLPYELTASFLLMADKPGVPRPIKLEEQHRALVPLDAPLSEDVGARLAAWAVGEGVAQEPVVADHVPSSAATGADELIAEIHDYALAQGNLEAVDAAIKANREKHSGDPAAHLAWLRSQVDRIRETASAVAAG